MKKLHYLALVAMLTCTGLTSSWAQESVKRMHIHDVYVINGLLSIPSEYASIGEFRKLAPGSELLNMDLAGFERSGGGYTLNNNIMMSMMVGIEFGTRDRSAYRPNPQLRLGYSYFNTTLLNGFLSKEGRFAYDTLTSSSNGDQIIVDSLSAQSVSMYYYSEQLRLDASLLFSTDPEARWTLFTGVGITAGFSVNARTEIHNFQYSWLETTEPDGRVFSSYDFHDAYTSQNEWHNAKTNFGMSVYVPVGIGFRIGNRRPLLRQLQLFYEGRPGVDINTIPELKTVKLVGGQHGIGLRVRW